MRFMVTTSPGLEQMLADELHALELDAVIEPSGVVAFEGDWSAASRALIGSRLASRVLLSIRAFSARTSAMLYDQVRRVEWPKYFSNQQSFAVFAHGTTEETDYALSFAPLKIKDAICDEFRKLGQDRPSVGRSEPDARIEAFIHGTRCELSLDLSGAPLHRRGYRLDGDRAPLRENRAAAMVLFAGYTGAQPLRDPFCGSGTIVIEAAMLAADRAPGLLRGSEGFAITKLFGGDARPEFQSVRAEFQRRAELAPAPTQMIVGSDSDAQALRAAEANVRRAGLSNFIRLERLDARSLRSPGTMMITNPPYGERLENAARAGELISDFTRQAKHECADSQLTLVLPRGPLEKSVGFKAKRKLFLANGPLPSVFAHYELFAGSRRAQLK